MKTPTNSWALSMNAWGKLVDRDLVESCYTPAALKALERFPVEADNIELIAHSENVTFRVSVRGSDTDYVLRLHRPGYNSIEELNSERIWTRALKEAGISVPDSLLTRGGQHFELIDIPGTGEQRHAGMTTWFEGEPLSQYLAMSSDGEERRRIYRRIGGIAAAIHNQSKSWKEPPGFERRRLDLEGLLGEEPHWGRFWEHAELTKAEKALLLRARQRARAALSAYGERPDNFSLIHADLHPANIVYNGEDLALIDFDDSAYGWHMYENASALIEDRFAPDFDALRIALLEGYREHRPLAGRDVDMLPAFLLIRGMAIIGWLHQRAEHAGSSYFEEVKELVLEECDVLIGKAGTLIT
jgi:Ser/Thr protein kinase RdoA (MazF antagonist)